MLCLPLQSSKQWFNCLLSWIKKIILNDVITWVWLNTKSTSSEAYLGPSQRSMMKLFSENCRQLRLLVVAPPLHSWRNTSEQALQSQIDPTPFPCLPALVLRHHLKHLLIIILVWSDQKANTEIHEFGDFTVKLPLKLWKNWRN